MKQIAYLCTTVSFSLQAIADNKLIFLLTAVIFLYASKTISHSLSPPSLTAVQYTVVRIFGSILWRNDKKYCRQQLIHVAFFNFIARFACLF